MTNANEPCRPSCIDIRGMTHSEALYFRANPWRGHEVGCPNSAHAGRVRVPRTFNSYADTIGLVQEQLKEAAGDE